MLLFTGKLLIISIHIEENFTETRNTQISVCLQIAFVW